MDLFHMKRYHSEEEEEEENDENEILEKLKAKSKKIKLTDQKVKEDVEEVIEEEVKENVQEPKKGKKKTKKKKTKNEGQTEFTVLGEDVDKNKSKVRRVLPEWLTSPEVIDTNFDKSQLTPIGEYKRTLNPFLIRKLEKEQVTHFFPVQKTVIPFLLPKKSDSYFPPNDVCVSAPTGSGKTLAFVLPILHALSNRITPSLRALVVLPVQDLALQVFKVFQTYAEGLCKDHIPLKIKLLSPKNSFANEQADLVREDVMGVKHVMADVIVTTPGRLVDHLSRTVGLDLTQLRYLVIDEADRVMADLQNNWLEEVEKAVYQGQRIQYKAVSNYTLRNWGIPLQKLLFSATLSQNPEQLERLNLFQPRLFTSVVNQDNEKEDFEFIGQYTTPAELTERLILVNDSLKKPQILHNIVKDHEKVLVFTNTLEHTHNLCVLLQSYGLNVAELSSQVAKKRHKTLNQLKTGAIDVLVCSDALARGIDIGKVDCVISYDMPKVVKTYIHRVGRTARAGVEGTAITLLETSNSEEKKMSKMLKEAGKEIEMEEFDCDELDEEAFEKASIKAGEIMKQETIKEKAKKTAHLAKRKKGKFWKNKAK